MIRKVLDTVSLVALVSVLAWPLGYAAGKLVSGAPDAALWLQASTTIGVLVLAGVHAWGILRREKPRAS